MFARGFALVPFIGLAVLGACGEADAPQYNGPNSLYNIPSPSKPSGDGACTQAKWLAVDPACTVKWRTDIHPKMKSGGAWNCGGTGCHVAGANDPTIDDDADATYLRLTKKTTSSKPYLNPCSKDPSASSFACNTHATGTCASAMPPAAGLQNDADKKLVNDWVACGAPKN